MSLIKRSQYIYRNFIIKRIINIIANLILERHKIIFKNIIYISLWAIVSLISSFNQIIPSFRQIINGNYSVIFKGDFYIQIIAPLLIWCIAFFVDYLYQIWTMGAKETLNKGWIAISNIAIIVIILLVLGIFYHENINDKRNILIGLMTCMITLKISALYVVSPSFSVEKR